MAHGNQFGSALGGSDSGETGDLKRISFGVLGQRFQDLGRHFYEGAVFVLALVRGFRGDVDHGGASAFVVVGELGHGEAVPSTEYRVPSTEDRVPRKTTSCAASEEKIRRIYTRPMAADSITIREATPADVPVLVPLV